MIRWLSRLASRWLGLPQLTVAGRLPVVHNHDELNALIALRHAKGNASRKGWETRRGLVRRLER